MGLSLPPDGLRTRRAEPDGGALTVETDPMSLASVVYGGRPVGDAEAHGNRIRLNELFGDAGRSRCPNPAGRRAFEAPPASLSPPVALAPFSQTVVGEPPAIPAAPAPGTEPPPPPPPPMVTRALQAGRWELRGSQHAWISPDAALREVETGRLMPGRWVWRGDQYRWRAPRVDTP